MYRSLLIALDKDDEAGSRLMAQRCRSLLACGPIAIHLAYVRTPLPHSYVQQLPKHWEDNERKEVEAWLHDYADQAGLSGSLKGVYAPAGSIAREIVELARSLNIEAIGVTAHRMDLGRLLLGTNTHAIVRDAPCDVIVMRELEG